MKGLIILLLTFSIVVMLVFLGWCIAEIYHALDNDCDDETKFYNEEDW